MGIFKKLSHMLSTPVTKADRALFLDVQCNKCGEILKARVDLWNELSPDYEGGGEDATLYHCRKVLIGENRCYQPIELRLRFDKNHKLVDKQVIGGKFIDENEPIG